MRSMAAAPLKVYVELGHHVVERVGHDLLAGGVLGEERVLHAVAADAHGALFDRPAAEDVEARVSVIAVAGSVPLPLTSRTAASAERVAACRRSNQARVQSSTSSRMPSCASQNCSICGAIAGTFATMSCVLRIISVTSVFASLAMSCLLWGLGLKCARAVARAWNSAVH